MRRLNARRLRVIDFGSVSPLRSQTLWHAIAHGVSAGGPPTLSLMQPNGPYVSIGFHRRIEEVDDRECRRSGLPIYRRMVGGGPVYLDEGQLFFQITVPVDHAPAVRARAVGKLLQPAVDAFQEVGIDARIEAAGDVVVGDRKICGHGAGQIEHAIVVVGNLIRSFDHAAATRIVATPNEATAEELESLMRRYVAATPTDATSFGEAAARSYASSLGLEADEGELDDVERRALDRFDARFVEDDWVHGPDRATPPIWRVKVKAGVFLAHVEAGHRGARVSVASGRILAASLSDPSLNGAGRPLETTMRGLTLAEARGKLDDAGFPALADLMGEMERATWS